MPAKPSSFSYAVFRYLKDPLRDLSIPIGVALWSEDRGWTGVRMPRSDEKLPRINKADDYPYISFVERKLNSWLSERTLPYASSELQPTSDSWWRHLREVLVHKVSLSEPHPIDCTEPDQEIELLFMSIVRTESADETALRVDSALTKALGNLAKKFKRGAVPGFAGKPVQVMRLFRGTKTTIVVDGVNLSVKDAAREADAMVGKMCRARSNGVAVSPLSPPDPEGGNFLGFVGYLSSAGGLNGEGYLKDWIEKTASVQTFDVIREREQMRKAIDRAVQEAGAPLFDEEVRP
jgi:Protein of unknown function (DUF3037)